MLKTCDSAFLHFAHRINFGELPYFLSHCFVVLLHRLLSLSSSKMTQFLRAVRAQCCPQYSSLCGCTSCRLGLGYARRSYSSQRCDHIPDPNTNSRGQQNAYACGASFWSRPQHHTPGISLWILASCFILLTPARQKEASSQGFMFALSFLTGNRGNTGYTIVLYIDILLPRPVYYW